MNINGLTIKVGTTVLFRKEEKEFVGQVDYIEKGVFLRGTWGEEKLNPHVENFSILRTHDGKLTHEGIAYNQAHPGNTV